MSFKLPRPARTDWTNWTSALKMLLLIRALWGMWGAFISALFPDTDWEARVLVWPPQLLSGDWWQRVWVSPWMRYDYEYYEHIVTRGYRLDDGSASFHPLFPLLAKPFYWLTGDAQLSLLIVSTLACWICCVLLARYVAKFYAPQLPAATQNATIQGAAWALILGPIGWILLAPYTESTFLAASIGAIWALRERRLWLAGALAALATLTRQQGLVLLVPLAWQWWQMARETEPQGFSRSSIFALSLPILAYASYSIYRVMILGETESASGWGALAKSWIVSPSTRLVVPGSGLSTPWKPFLETLRLIKAFPISQVPTAYALYVDWLLGWAMAGFGLWACKYLRPRSHTLEIVYSLAVIAAALCFYSAPYLSLPRHVFLAWLLPIALAIIAARTGRTRWTLEALALANLMLFSAFVRHSWVP